MPLKINIAVDGYAACGKSTLAKELAKSLGYIYIDSGAMYRAITLYFLRHKINLKDAGEVAEALQQIKIHFELINGQNTTFLNKENVEEEIRKMYVSNHVSNVAANSHVRSTLVALQKEMGKDKGVVMDGRDIGTVVFKDAKLKLFMTATMAIRVQRRVDEMESKGISTTPEAVQLNLETRDYIDSNRKDSPLSQAEDAVVLDNSNLSQEEQLVFALDLALERIKAHAL